MIRHDFMDTCLHDESIYDGLDALGLRDDIQGWNSDHEVFKNLIFQTRPKVIIEVGSWKGASAIGMLEKCEQIKGEQHFDPPGDWEPHIFCVDTWLGSPEIWLNKALVEMNPRRHGYPQVYFQFLHNVKTAGFSSRVTPLPMTSRAGAGLLSDHQVKAGLIYIDASHDYIDVKHDVEMYWCLLKSGGVMFGDDWPFAPVRVAVNEFAEKHDLALQVVDDNFWVMRKLK